MLAFAMAGGPHAEDVPCFECLDGGKVTKATRVCEGAETDQYVCELGHQFGIDYRSGPATGPQWPPPPELVAAFSKGD
jgi:hypothetical protein